VLNGANVISGTASLCLSDYDRRGSVDREDLVTIRKQSEDVAAVVQEVRTLLEATQTDTATEVDLATLLDDELATLERQYEDVEVTADLAEGVVVRAESLLTRVFENLLRNAVEHNDTAPRRVHVTMEPRPETITVRVEDNGPGIPDEERETLFERSAGDHGFGLYLTAQLVRRYGGAIELTDTGPDGTVFTVTLPRARQSHDEQRRVRTAPTAGSAHGA